MKSLRRLLTRLFNSAAHREQEDRLREEIEGHIALQTAENVRAGMSEIEARRQAILKFGGIEPMKEDYRAERGVMWIENLVRDLRLAFRMLRKSRGFTAVALITLAVAIGANAVVFAVLNALILRPLNVPHSETLYSIDRATTGTNKIGFQSYADYIDLRDRNRSFDSLAAYNIAQAGLDTGENASSAWVYEVTGNYFDTLGVQPYLGRLLHSSDDRGPNSAPYIVLTYGYWHTRFQDDAGVVGRIVQLNKHPFTIIGVAPPDFHGTLLFFAPDFLVPMINHEQIEGENLLNIRGTRWVFSVLGHLKTGVKPAQAVADLNSIGSYLETTYPKDDGHATFSLARPGLYSDFLGGPITAFVTGLMLLAGLILLAACANLGSLFSARAADRSREVALRLALGATRSRILRQLFTEAVLIAVAGGVIGLTGSVALLRLVSLWQPFPRFPMVLPVSPDANVYAVALLLALASGLLFGAVPVRQVLHTDPYEIVKSGSLGRVGSRLTIRDLSLVVQIAICAVLITSSMVALRGLARSLHSNFGFEPQNALLVSTTLTMAGYTAESSPAMQKDLLDTVAAIPDVASVGLINEPPLAMGGTTSIVFTDETTDFMPGHAAAQPYFYKISPDYFRAAGTALLAGRSLSLHDGKDAPRVAVINRNFADKLFGSVNNAVGRYFKRRDATRIQVVGVVEDGKYLNLTEEQRSAMFVPLLQFPQSSTWLVVRSPREPQQIAQAVKIAIQSLDPGLPVFIQTWPQALNGALFGPRVATIALGILGVMGAMLSITGIFGMAAYSVSKRLRELGIRMALGAQRKQVLQAALARPFKLLAIGSAAGLLLGILAARLLAFVVYHATPRDPLVLAGVVLAMSLLGLVAAWIPAQRALSADPLSLLREQ